MEDEVRDDCRPKPLHWSMIDVDSEVPPPKKKKKKVNGFISSQLRSYIKNILGMSYLRSYGK